MNASPVGSAVASSTTRSSAAPSDGLSANGVGFAALFAPIEAGLAQGEPTALPVSQPCEPEPAEDSGTPDPALLAALGLAPLPLVPAETAPAWTTVLGRGADPNAGGAAEARGDLSIWARADADAPPNRGDIDADPALRWTSSQREDGQTRLVDTGTRTGGALSAQAASALHETSTQTTANAGACATPAMPAGAPPWGPTQTADASSGMALTAGPDEEAAQARAAGLATPDATASLKPRGGANFSTATSPTAVSAADATKAATRVSEGDIATQTALTDRNHSPIATRPASEPATTVSTPTAALVLERAELNHLLRDSVSALAPMAPAVRMEPGSPQFGAALGQQMMWMASQQVGRAELRLAPDELGPLEISLEMNGDEIRAEFATRSAEVRSLLETQVPRLRELLAEQGFNLTDAQVGQERAAYQEAPQQREAFAARSGNPAASDTEAEADAPAAVITRIHQGLVDDYA